MCRTKRFLVPWLPLFLLVTLPAAPGMAPSRAHDGVRTVEPTLPLVIDMGVSRAPAGGTAAAELRVELLAGPAIEDLSLTLDLPDGVTAVGDDTRLRGRQPALVPGERRSFALPLQARPGASRDIRLRASFRLADGRTFSLMQGAALPYEAPDRRGRRHAGAYEVLGVPLSDLRP
jgi:hypothetical protein